MVEIVVNEGDLLQRGDPVLSLEQVGKEIRELNCILYVSGGDGKKVRPGMGARISSSTAKKEEFGVMLAKEFARQRSTRFEVESVANNVSTIVGFFPVVASIATFYVLEAGKVVQSGAYDECDFRTEQETQRLHAYRGTIVRM